MAHIHFIMFIDSLSPQINKAKTCKRIIEIPRKYFKMTTQVYLKTNLRTKKYKLPFFLILKSRLKN